MGIDFIMDIPLSEKGNDCIVTFVHHFAKRAYRIPFVKALGAARFAQIFLEAIVRLHRVP
jgi:hypothetical protein